MRFFRIFGLLGTARKIFAISKKIWKSPFAKIAYVCIRFRKLLAVHFFSSPARCTSSVTQNYSSPGLSRTGAPRTSQPIRLTIPTGLTKPTRPNRIVQADRADRFNGSNEAIRLNGLIWLNCQSGPIDPTDWTDRTEPTSQPNQSNWSKPTESSRSLPDPTQPGRAQGSVQPIPSD